MSCVDLCELISIELILLEQSRVTFVTLCVRLRVQAKFGSLMVHDDVKSSYQSFRGLFINDNIIGEREGGSQQMRWCRGQKMKENLLQ